MQRFNCRRCGKCCALAVPVSEQDLLRWAIEYRTDILRRISPRDGLIHAEGAHCPFLVRSPQGVYGCRIYQTRPIACVEFPLSEQQAERIDCLGWRSRTTLAQGRRVE